MAALVNHFISALSIGRIIGVHASEIIYYIPHFNCSKANFMLRLCQMDVAIYIEGNRNSKIFRNRYKTA